MQQCAWIMPETGPEAMAARCVAALEHGSRVLILHEGAARGAALQLALEASAPSGAALATVHLRGGDSEYRDALDPLLHLGGRLEVIISGADPLACAAVHARIRALCDPLVDDVSLHCGIEVSAISPYSLEPILAHEWVEHGSIRLPTNTVAERLRAIDLLLATVSRLDHIDALGEQCSTLGYPAVELAHLLAQARVRHIQAKRLVDLESEVSNLRQQLALLHSHRTAQTSCAAAMRSSGGEVVIALRQAASILHQSILVEDPAFCPMYWSDAPGPAPPSLSELLGPSRARSVASKLQVGTPETVRLGAPAGGARLVLRLGERPVVGYVSLLGSPLTATIEIAETLLWLEPLLLVACRAQQSARSLSERLMSGVVHALCDDGFTDEERLDAADLIAWRPDTVHRVTFSRYERSHPGTPSEVVSLRREARRSGLTVGVHGDGLVGLVADDEKELSTVTSWALERHQSVGVSEVTMGARNTPHAVRQARWAAQIARETGRSIVRFDDLGIETLSFPGAELGTLPALRPLRLLEEAGRHVGFDATETLRVLFACGSNIKEAAARLAVHPNTLRYRLERLATTTGIDLADHDVAFELELALRIETGRRASAVLGDRRRDPTH
jgi:DNA-binding transcriptional MerR regulator